MSISVCSYVSSKKLVTSCSTPAGKSYRSHRIPCSHRFVSSQGSSNHCVKPMIWLCHSPSGPVTVVACDRCGYTQHNHTESSGAIHDGYWYLALTVRIRRWRCKINAGDAVLSAVVRIWLYCCLDLASCSFTMLTDRVFARNNTNTLATTDAWQRRFIYIAYRFKALIAFWALPSHHPRVFSLGARDARGRRETLYKLSPDSCWGSGRIGDVWADPWAKRHALIRNLS